MNIDTLLKYAIKNNASDIHITVASPPVLRIDGSLVNYGQRKLYPDEVKNMLEQLLDQVKLTELYEHGQVDTTYSIPAVGRFRINAFKQRGNYGMVIRVIPFKIPTIDELGLPYVVRDLVKTSRGLILVTGPAGSGKSTTLAAIINLGVIIAGILVNWLSSSKPDLIIGTVVFVLVIQGAFRILKLSK